MATLTLIVVAILWTDHLSSLIGTNVKQLGFAPAQLVQNHKCMVRDVPRAGINVTADRSVPLIVWLL